VNYRVQTTMREDVQLKARIYSPEPLMRGLAGRALSAILGRIDHGVGPENAPLTKAIKQGDQTLRDKGQLLGSLHGRSGRDFAEVASNHIAAIVNNPTPDDGRQFNTVRPVKAKALTVPAGPQTRTMMRRYGHTPRAVIAGMQAAGYIIFRPFKKGSKSRSNVIMAVLPQVQKKPLVLAAKTSGPKIGPARAPAKKYQAFALFFLVSSVKVPVRRFMYLTDDELAGLEAFTQEYYLG